MSHYDAVVKTVKEAGEILLKYFGRVDAVNNKSGSGSGVVTKLDIEIEKFIADRLQKHDPSIGFVGEENGVFHLEGEKYWLVDPIDGTAHFIRGIPLCTIMIALIDKGEVVLSVIHNFVTNELYSAEKGKGAKLNDKPIYVSNRTLKEAYISVESKLEKVKDVEIFMNLKKKSTLFHTITCGFEFALIASGKFDGRICFNPYGDDYDFAPGSLLVSEAGGIVTNIGKRTYDFKNHNFIATNKIIHEELTNGKNVLFSLL